MCRPKPGPRCPSCQDRALASIAGRLERLAGRIKETDPGPKRADLEAQARDLARQVACRRADLYATAAFQRETGAQLEHLLATTPKHPDVPVLAGQLLEGRIMDRYRREQAAVMPPRPGSDAALVQYRALGDARFDIAHARLRMDMARGNTAEWQVWQDRHHQAAQRAALASARMKALDSNGDSGWSGLTQQERLRRRDAEAADPTLATPVAPRRWADVVDETQDILDGHTPAREKLDDSGYPPFGDQVPGKQVSTTPVTRADPAPDGPAASDPADAARKKSLTQQSRRRRSRRRNSMSSYRQLRTGSRRLEATARRTDSALEEMTPNTQNNGGIYDLTLLSYISETLTKR